MFLKATRPCEYVGTLDRPNMAGNVEGLERGASPPRRAVSGPRVTHSSDFARARPRRGTGREWERHCAAAHGGGIRGLGLAVWPASRPAPSLTRTGTTTSASPGHAPEPRESDSFPLKRFGAKNDSFLRAILERGAARAPDALFVPGTRRSSSSTGPSATSSRSCAAPATSRGFPFANTPRGRDGGEPARTAST